MIRFQVFRIVKFSLVENSKWPSVLKIAKPIKSAFFQNVWDILVEWNIRRTLMLTDIKRKTSVAELGHNDPLKIYIDPNKICFDPGI